MRWRARRQAGAPKRRGRIERQRWTQPAAASHIRVTTGTVARVHLRLMRSMAGETPRADAAMIRPDVKRLIAPVRVATRRRARLRGRLGRFLGVGVVARPALPGVRILRRVEVAEHLPHLVAAQALLLAGNQRPASRVAGRQGRDVGLERVATGAVTRRLSRHLAEDDVGLALLVTTALATRSTDRLEPVHFSTVARDALELPEVGRVGLEVDAMAGGRRDALPARAIARDVAGLAHAVRHEGVLADVLGTLGDPDVELPRAREDRLRVTVVARQLGVFVRRAGESLERRAHDVAPGAEVVRVLGVVPRGGAHADCRRGNHERACRERERHATRARPEPRPNLPAAPNEIPDDDETDHRAKHGAADLDPRRYGVEQKPYEPRNAPRQRRLHEHGVSRRRWPLLKRRRPGQAGDDGARDHRGHHAMRRSVTDSRDRAPRAWRAQTGR